MRTNRANNHDEPRHRKAGPARLGGSGTGRRARDLGELEAVEQDGATEVEERSA